MVKEKAKPISLEELDEQIRRKEQSQDSNNANDSWHIYDSHQLVSGEIIGLIRTVVERRKCPKTGTFSEI